MNIYVVPRWKDRFCLNFEWIMLPVGIGMGIVAPTNVVLILMGQRHGWLLAISILMIVIPAIALPVGLWRPIHRRFGFTRRTLWTKP